MYDIVALGECLIDFTPHGCSDSGIPLFQQNPGGAPANVLAEAAKLGCSTAFIGKVGDDSFGNFLERILVDAGIDCSSMIKDPSINVVNLTMEARMSCFQRRMWTQGCLAIQGYSISALSP